MGRSLSEGAASGGACGGAPNVALSRAWIASSSLSCAARSSPACRAHPFCSEQYERVPGFLFVCCLSRFRLSHDLPCMFCTWCNKSAASTVEDLCHILASIWTERVKAVLLPLACKDEESACIDGSGAVGERGGEASSSVKVPGASSSCHHVHMVSRISISILSPAHDSCI